mmetsp:Transcript_30106/g.78120  ORF Transcript_30106/g.78120 Transcript_30106/m.78120 type:complete len:134 (-) Transcript_30106:293-694(-)|eukprot:881664-Pelagomonas_calceolata.AAC.2
MSIHTPPPHDLFIQTRRLLEHYCCECAASQAHSDVASNSAITIVNNAKNDEHIIHRGQAGHMSPWPSSAKMLKTKYMQTEQGTHTNYAYHTYRQSRAWPEPLKVPLKDEHVIYFFHQSMPSWPRSSAIQEQLL